MSELKSKIVKNILWSFLEQVLTKGVTVVTTLILAWFLVPEDYALVAMLAVFIALSGALVGAGLDQALIRKLEVTEIELTTVFWTNILIAIIVYSILFASAPLIASFYEEPRLIDLIRIVSLTVFFKALVVVQQTVLSRALKFKLQVKVVLPSTILSSIIAVGMAKNGYGIWALIYQILSNSIFIAIFYWLLRLWRPSFTFSFVALKGLWGFSKFIVLDTLVAIPFTNMYLIVLPKYFSAGPVGLYFFAEKIKEVLIGLVINSVQTVTYPALAKIQEDQTRLKEGYRKVIATTTFLMFPLMLFLAALVPIIFELILPDKWYGAAIYIQLLCLASVMYPLHSLNINILRVKGKSNIVFYIGIYKRVVNVLVFIYMLQLGIIWVIIGQIILSVIHFLPNAYYSSKIIDYTIKEQLVDFLPGLVLSGLIAGLVYYLQVNLEWVAIVKLIVLGFLAIFLYITAAYFFKFRALQLAQELIKKKINSRNKH